MSAKDEQPKIFAVVRNGDHREAHIVDVWSWAPNAVDEEMKRWASFTTGTQKFEVYECTKVREVSVGISLKESPS